MARKRKARGVRTTIVSIRATPAVTPATIARQLSLRAIRCRGDLGSIKLTRVELEGFLQAAADLALKYCAIPPIETKKGAQSE